MMKYYAVTDDPNELLHYGVKGMKWGEHIFGDKFKSAGYKRALGKLRSISKKTSSAVKKSSSQRQMDKQKKQQEKYNNAVKSAQQRIKVVEGLNRITKLGSQEKNTARQMRIQQKKDKIAAKKEAISQRNELAAAKTDLKYFKNVSKMDKFTQKAREGKLKYGKLSDDQVGQIVNRLNMEQNARRLGSTEKSWHQQKKEARRKGKLLGIEKGTAAAMEEVARAGTVWGVHHLMNRVKMNAAAKQEGKEEHIRNRAKNKKTRKEVRQDIRNEMYEEAIASGKGILERRPRLTTAGAARKLESIRNENLEAERVRKLNARMNDEIDMANNRKYQKMLSNQREKKRIQDVKDRLNNDIDDRWQKHLAETGASDFEARASLYGANSARKARDDDAQKQRLAILSKTDKEKNEAAYRSLVSQQKAEENHEKKVAKLESENKKLKADYEDERKRYEQDAEYDRKLKDKFDKDTSDYNRAVADFKAAMNDYNDKHNAWVKNKQQYGYYAIEPKKPVFSATKPTPPKYRSTPEPKKPKYHDIDYSTPKVVPKLPDTYEEYMRLKALYGGNNGGGKRKGK